MRPLLTATAILTLLAATPAHAEIPKVPPPIHREPCWAGCTKALTLKPGVPVSWTMRQRFRVNREQAISLYLGRRERRGEKTRLGAGQTIRCTLFAQGAGIMLRVDAPGCKTRRRVRLRFAVVSLRRKVTHTRLALIDRPYLEPVEELPDLPTDHDQWGRPDTDRCYGVDPALPYANCPLPPG